MRPNYIREACRLLQQSIIFVEMEDVELEEGDGDFVSSCSSFIHLYLHLFVAAFI